MQFCKLHPDGTTDFSSSDGPGECRAEDRGATG